MCLVLLACIAGCVTTGPINSVSAPSPLCASYPWWGFGQIRQLRLAKVDASIAESSSRGRAIGTCEDATSPAFELSGDEASAAEFILAAFAHPERGRLNVMELSNGIISLTAFTHTCGEQKQSCVSGYLQAGDPRGQFYTLDMTVQKNGDGWRYLKYEEGGHFILYH